MRKLVLVIMTMTIFACNDQNKKSESSVDLNNKIDIQAELESIEETRSAFELAVKEKRYSDLGQFVTSDMKSVTPGSEDWLEYKRLREEPMGKFSYDSINMSPQETVIVSDSVAYDYGTSVVYYTNEKGEAVELHDTFLVILKKDKDGKWKIHREVASAGVE